MQRLLYQTRDAAIHWFKTTGGLVMEPLPARRQPPRRMPTLGHLKYYENRLPPARGYRRGHNLALALWQFRDDCLSFVVAPSLPSPHTTGQNEPCT